jgi:hypothetical protein
MIGVIVALAWLFLVVVVLGLCKVAARADAHFEYGRADDRQRGRERVGGRDRMRPAAL